MRGDYYNTKEPKRGGVKYMIVTRKKSSTIRLTRDQVTYLLEHILLQDLSQHEDRRTDQVHCNQHDGQLSLFIDR